MLYYNEDILSYKTCRMF